MQAMVAHLEGPVRTDQSCTYIMSVLHAVPMRGICPCLYAACSITLHLAVL